MAAHGSDLSFSIVALDNASKTFIKLGEQVGKLQDKLEKLDRERVEATVDVDTDRAGRKIDTFSSDLRTKVSAAVRSLPKINIDADSTVADAKLAQIRNELVELGDKTIGVDIDANDARAELSSLQEQLNRLSHDSPDVAVRVNTAEASSQLARFEAQMAKLDRKDVDVKVKADTSQATKALDSFSNRFALMAAGIVAASPIAGGAILSGIGGAFVTVAAIAQASNNDLRRNVLTLGTTFGNTLRSVTEQNLPALQNAVSRLNVEVVRMGPQLRTAFSYANPAIHNLTTGVIGAERGLMAGLVPAMRVSGTATRGLSDLMTTMGRTVGNSLIILSQHAGAFSNVMASTGRIVQPIVQGLMRAISGMAEGWSRNSAQIELSFQQLTSTVSAFASGAMAGLGGAFRSAMTLANGLLYALSPIAGALGNIAGYLGPVILGFRAFGSIRSGLSGVSDKLLDMAASTEGMASRFSNFGTRASSALNNVSDGLGVAATGFTGFGSKMANVGAKGLLSLSRLAGFMSKGGVLGIAIAGVSLLLSWLGQKQEEAAKDARDHQQMINSLAQALEESNGTIDANVRKTQAQSLQNDKNAKTLMANGYSLKQITTLTLSSSGAINNQIDLLQRQNATLQQTVNKHATFNQVGVKTVKHMDAIGVAAQNNIDKNNKSIAAWRKLNGTYGQAQKKQQALSDALKATGDASMIARNNVAQIDATLGSFYDATTSADDAIKQLQDELESIGASGTEKARIQIEQAADAMRGFKDQVKDASGAVLDQNGQFNAWSEKGKLVDDTTRKVRDAMAGYAVQARAGSISTHTARGNMQRMRDTLEKELLPAFGGNKKAVDRYLDSMGLIPANILTKVDIFGASKATQDLQRVQDNLQAVPGHKTVTVSTLSKTAETDLKNLGFKVVHLPNGQIRITAKDQSARTVLNAFLKYASQHNTTMMKLLMNSNPAQQKLLAMIAAGNGAAPMVKLGADDKRGRRTLAQLVKKIQASGGRVTIGGNRVPANMTVNQLVNWINHHKAGVLRVNGNTNPAKRAVNALQAWLNGRPLTMKVRYDYQAAHPLRGPARYLGGPTQAIGHIVHPYAQGGMEAARQSGLRPMSPIAQVVAPNTWRVVGDRMTDDEAYIPLDGSNRSKAILLTAAQKLFGMASGGLLADGVGGAAAMSAVTGASSTVVAPVASVSAPAGPVLSPAAAPPVGGGDNADSGGGWRKRHSVRWHRRWWR